jgi:S1-C subfamily serine protease
MNTNLRTMGLGIVAATVVSLVGASTTFADPFYYRPQPVQPFVGPIGSPVRPHLGIMEHFQFGLGMVVDQVFPGSSADRMGLERGDVIHRINGHEIANEWTYRHALNQAVQFDNGRVNLHVMNARTGMRSVRTGFVSANPGFVVSQPTFGGNPYGNGTPVRPW